MPSRCGACSRHHEPATGLLWMSQGADNPPKDSGRVEQSASERPIHGVRLVPSLRPFIHTDAIVCGAAIDSGA